MRSSQKSGRGRGKNNRNKSQNHSPNRVYESAGPEGKVRGTPQQIIDKYQALARDHQLSGDRVAAENFLQHAEHYARILISVQEAQAERQQQHAQQNGGGNGGQQPQSSDQGEAAAAQPQQQRPQEDPSNTEQPSSDGLATLDAQLGEEPSIVETPESASQAPSRPRRPRPKPKPEAPTDAAEASEPVAD